MLLNLGPSCEGLLAADGPDAQQPTLAMKAINPHCLKP
jgi:hypothetical protein